MQRGWYARWGDLAQRANPGTARAPWWERNIQYLLPLPVVLLLALFVVYPTITIPFCTNSTRSSGERWHPGWRLRPARRCSSSDAGSDVGRASSRDVVLQLSDWTCRPR